jgi:nucleoside-diphosphate-sugar epimerase
MNILLIGAAGLIGAAIAARLVAAGHRVVGVARHPSGDRDGMTWRTLDLAAASAEHWGSLLHGIDAVVNCAGLLQDTPGRATVGVHAAGPAVLFRACVQAGVRRVIHFSAIGVDRERPTEFLAQQACRGRGSHGARTRLGHPASLGGDRTRRLWGERIDAWARRIAGPAGDAADRAAAGYLS